MLLRINDCFKTNNDIAFLKNKFLNSGIFSQNVSLKIAMFQTRIFKKIRRRIKCQ